MHKTFIEARWDEGYLEWFDVGCEDCKFFSVGHAAFGDATRVAAEHEALRPVPWFRRGRD